MRCDVFVREAKAKEILARYGIAVPDGEVAADADAARSATARLSAARYVVKALIHAGGRGNAGGVRFAEDAGAVARVAGEMLGGVLVTTQTRPEGETIEAVYIEEAIDFDASLYLSILLDPGSARPVLLASPAGGVDFEEKARDMPTIVQKFVFGYDGGFDPGALAVFLENLGVGREHADAVKEVIPILLRLFRETDASLVEINPLALLPDGSAMAIDAKIVLDANALFRHPEFAELAGKKAADETEMIAQRNEINFVSMPGDIGLVVNGAGLGLATHDMVIDAEGAPANFMDIRTMATSEQIARGIGLLLNNPAVRVLLVNIHGGGMTSCDVVSAALARAYRDAPRAVPVVFRAAGQNANRAVEDMEASGIAFETAGTMGEAVGRAVEIARGTPS